MTTDTKCAPENCPVLGWSSLSPSEQRAQRKEKAKELYERGFTIEAIAAMFGVSFGTIQGDLSDLSKTDKSERSKSSTNPKGAGRPKGSKPKNKIQQRNVERDNNIIALWDEGVPTKEIAAKFDIVPRQVSQIIEHERIRREAVAGAEIDPATLSMSAQEKLAAAIRQHKAQLDRAFEARVNEEVRRRIVAADDATRKQNAELRQENLRLSQLLNQRGVFTESQYNKLMMCVHPDNSASEHTRREVQILLNDKNNQRRLIKETPANV